MKDVMGSYKGSNVKHGKYSDGSKPTFGEAKSFAGSHRKTTAVKKFKGTGTNHKTRSFK